MEPAVREELDPYRVLGVSPSATQAQIVHAYRARLRAHHPDTRNAPSPGDDEELRQVLAAYALLRDPARRAAHDAATARPAATESFEIRVTHRSEADSTARATTDSPPPPLWVGPVRRHR